MSGVLAIFLSSSCETGRFKARRRGRRGAPATAVVCLNEASVPGGSSAACMSRGPALR